MCDNLWGKVLCSKTDGILGVQKDNASQINYQHWKDQCWKGKTQNSNEIKDKWWCWKLNVKSCSMNKLSVSRGKGRYYWYYHHYHHYKTCFFTAFDLEWEEKRKKEK